MRMIRVVVVDDNQPFLDGLAAALSADDSIEAVGVPPPLPQARQRIEGLRPDVVLINRGIRDDQALELTHWIGSRLANSKILIVGLDDTEEEILRFIQAMANGYVLKSASLDDLKRSIRTVVNGEARCSPKVAYRAFIRLAELSQKKPPANTTIPEDLTPRELQVLELLAENLTNKEIAQRLFLSLHTVKNHVHNILDKLPARNRRGAVAHAYREQWLPDRRRH